MSKVAKGTVFEKAVEKVINYLYSKYNVISIQRNVFIDGPDGNRQIDVLITVTIADLSFIVAVECKNYAGRVPIGKIDEFVSKLRDIKAAKGIMISSNGFSSPSIKKAKRSEITLYSLKDTIDIESKELDIPIIIQEVIPFETEFKVSISREKGLTMMGETLILDPIIVNGNQIYDILKSNWESQNLDFNITTNFQEISIPQIKPPFKIQYFINEANNVTDEVEMENFIIKLKLKINYYVIYLKELVGLNVLNNIHENKIQMFIDSDTILSSLPNAKLISKTIVDEFTGLKAIILIKGPFNIKTEGLFHSIK